MAGISAHVEDNGWVLAVRGTWGATAGGWVPPVATNDWTNGAWQNASVDQFPLDPDGTPKVTVAVTSKGYARSGGQAVADSAIARSVVATKVIRRPYPDQAQLDEVDHGDGTRTLRFALSDRVYADDTVASVAFLAGWKAGEDAATITEEILNASDLAYPVPIVRAATLPFTFVRGVTAVQADWIVASHFPSTVSATRHEPLAAVKVVATDGTHNVTTWLTGLRTSPLYGDDLRCVGGEIDLDGLDAGIVTLVATFYPWIGTVRTIGSSQVVDVAVPLSASADEPLVLCYDPSNSRYLSKHIYVDPVNGTETVASVTVADSLALAKAGTAAKTVSVASQAIAALNVSLPAANGMAGGGRVADGATITLAAGTHGWGTQGATSGYGAVEAPLIVQGDPDDEDPRANCVFQSGSSANPNLRNRRWHFRNLTIEAGQTTFLTSDMTTTEHVTVRGKTGYESATNSVFFGSPPTGYYNQAHADLVWAYGAATSSSSVRPGLMRGVVSNQKIAGVVLIGVRTAVGHVVGKADFLNFQAGVTDQMVWNCAGWALAGKYVGFVASEGAGTAGDVATLRRLAIINSLAEHSTNDNYNFFSLGENEYTQFVDSVFEGNTFVGQRINIHNNSPSPFVDLKHVGNVSRNNYYDRQATKHDLFDQVTEATGSWEWLYGVSHRGNVIANRIDADASNFQYAWAGLNAAVDTGYDGYGGNGWTKFTADKSHNGPQAPSGDGWGDYTPDAGSPLLGRASVASVDEFADGTARGARFTGGAIATDLALPAEIAVASVRHSLTDTGVVLHAVRVVRPAVARLLVTSGSAGIVVQAVQRRQQALRMTAMEEEDRRFTVDFE